MVLKRSGIKISEIKDILQSVLAAHHADIIFKDSGDELLNGAFIFRTPIGQLRCTLAGCDDEESIVIRAGLVREDGPLIVPEERRNDASILIATINALTKDGCTWGLSLKEGIPVMLDHMSAFALMATPDSAEWEIFRTVLRLERAMATHLPLWEYVINGGDVTDMPKIRELIIQGAEAHYENRYAKKEN